MAINIKEPKRRQQQHYWHCPNCGHILTHACLTLANFTECPRCEGTKLGDFHRYFKIDNVLKLVKFNDYKGEEK